VTGHPVEDDAETGLMAGVNKEHASKPFSV
jgi:hypothetical protein